MMAQPRDERGRFAAGSAVGDHQASQTPSAGHGHPVMAQYDGSKSVGTHAPTRTVTNTVRERQAVLAGVDARVGKRNVYHG
jgi:hypothetical protein